MTESTPRALTASEQEAASRWLRRRAGDLISNVYGDAPEGMSADEWESRCERSDLEILANAAAELALQAGAVDDATISELARVLCREHEKLGGSWKQSAAESLIRMHLRRPTPAPAPAAEPAASEAVCMKCGRPFATVDDFRAIRENDHALDGLCPTGYAIRDPDAAADCESFARAAAGVAGKGESPSVAQLLTEAEDLARAAAGGGR